MTPLPARRAAAVSAFTAGFVRPGLAGRVEAVWGEVVAPRARIFEVGELAEHIGALIAHDPTLQDVWLRGEVANLSRPASGHFYFCLKDHVSQLKTVLFRGAAARSVVLPANGLSVVAHGAVRFYERQGTCQLVADLLFPEGIGLAQMQFEALYRRLEAEGLFDAGRKRPLPEFPRRIGLVTSASGAVVHDLLTVLGRRYPLAEVALCPARVQGAGAPEALVGGLRALQAWRSSDGDGVDLVILARGGGSNDDLAAFNDEGLARAIFACRVPVVSAVGHETDVTLADLVADVRAPTPSAAAEMVSPDVDVLRREVAALRARATYAARGTLLNAAGRVHDRRRALGLGLSHQLQVAREQVTGRRLQLGALSPRATLGRGYALAESAGGVVRDARQVSPGESLLVHLHRGQLDVSVAATHPG